MRKFRIVSFLFISLYFLSCRQSEENLIFSQEQLTAFIKTHSIAKPYKVDIAAFYQKRNYTASWLNNRGLNNHAKKFLARLQNEYQTGSYNPSPQEAAQLKSLNELAFRKRLRFKTDDSLAANTDFLFTAVFLQFASDNWNGTNDEYLKKSKWLIKRKDIDLPHLLDSLLTINEEVIATYEPVYYQYGLLKKQLIKYIEIESKGGWTMLSPDIKKLKIGDDNNDVRSVKQELFLMGDLDNNDNTTMFNDELETAVKSFQKRNGIEPDGIIADKTIDELNISVKDRISEILLNMERYRWMPEHLKGDNLIVNVPEYKLHVYNDDKEQWSSNVVVGNDSNNTVIFNDVMEYIVFAPYWNIPGSIIEKETAPGMVKNKNYLANHNMEVVDQSGKAIDESDIDWKDVKENFPYIIRQKPGGNNSLGRVKFLLPNSHNIYLHDSPAKSLFNETDRAFSHGCIRLSEPLKLAKYLLRNEPEWTDEKIEEAMNAEEEKTVKLVNKVPVYIAYFTAWVDGDGKLNFRDDIYGHNQRLKKLMNL